MSCSQCEWGRRGLRRPLPYRSSADAEKTGAPKPDPIAEMDTRILEQVKSDQGELQSNLQYLADRIGPRLTGSPQLEQASHWTMERRGAPEGDGFTGASFVDPVGRANHPCGDAENGRSQAI